MKIKFFFLVFIIILIIGIFIGIYIKGKVNKSKDIDNNMKLTSSDFENNEKIPVKFTGDGEDINPNLIISDVPENVKSFVLIIDDPDAPVGVWVHWLVWNIPANVREIKENSVPERGVQGKNSWDKNNYRGPNPPSGTHRYFFKIYALDCILDLDEDTGVDKLERAMENHILNKAELVGLYR